MNEEKKFIHNIKEINTKELKRYVQELEAEYKRSKDELKKASQNKTKKYKYLKFKFKLVKTKKLIGDHIETDVDERKRGVVEDWQRSNQERTKAKRREETQTVGHERHRRVVSATT